MTQREMPFNLFDTNEKISEPGYDPLSTFQDVTLRTKEEQVASVGTKDAEGRQDDAALTPYY